MSPRLRFLWAWLWAAGSDRAACFHCLPSVQVEWQISSVKPFQGSAVAVYLSVGLYICHSHTFSQLPICLSSQFVSFSLFFYQQSSDCWFSSKASHCSNLWWDDFRYINKLRVSTCCPFKADSCGPLVDGWRYQRVLLNGAPCFDPNRAWSIITDVTGMRVEHSSCGGFMWAECVAGAVTWFWARVPRPSS